MCRKVIGSNKAFKYFVYYPIQLNNFAGVEVRKKLHLVPLNRYKVLNLYLKIDQMSAKNCPNTICAYLLYV